MTFYDFVNVYKNGATVFSGTGIGPSPIDGFKLETISIAVVPTDEIVVELEKDAAFYGGYDILYFHVGFTEPQEELEVTIPSDLSEFVGKDIEIASESASLQHLIRLQSPLAINGAWSTFKFTGACSIRFSVSENNAISLVSRDSCVLFCPNSNGFGCVDLDEPNTSNAFHGWYKAITKGATRFTFMRFDATTVPNTIQFYGLEECVSIPKVD